MSEQPEEHKVVVRDRRKIDPETGAAREPDPADTAVATAGDQSAAAAASGRSPADPPLGAGVGEGPAPAAGGASAGEVEVAALLAERTADLQRMTAEYANYRKRVDRDRASVADGATRTVLAMLLPVLDDIERAREHGDLTGAFKSVADQLEGVLEKLGLRPFGTAGDPFDPTLHEAVAHRTGPEVTVPTCAQVLRRGYKHGDRLLRPALVGVADPEPAPPPATEPVAPSDLPGLADDGPDDRAGVADRAGPAGGADATGTAGATGAEGGLDESGPPRQPGGGAGD